MNNRDMPAYPVDFFHTIDDGAVMAGGLTKLEDFTKAAVQGLCANPNLIQGVNPSDDYLQLIGKTARAIAEAALAELERRG